MSNVLENYKEHLTQRRHDRMLEFMTSDRPYLTGSVSSVFATGSLESAQSAKASLMFHGDIYHEEIADDIKSVLLQAPVLRYGILTGPNGSGKSRLIRTLVREQDHYAVLSMGLISGVKSLVDALSEEIGYDFDDWTERILQGYLFNGSSVTFPTQLDKLAFLLDEFEEACWSLKFSEETGTSGRRPVLVLDDIDLLDSSDKETQHAIRMLFNAANKWSREDTALVVFTTGAAALAEGGALTKVVRPEVLGLAKVYRVGCLSRESAERFLRDRLAGVPVHAVSASAIETVVGTRLFDMIKVCDEVVKRGHNVDNVLSAQLDAAIRDVRRALTEVGHRFGERKMRTLLSWLDRVSSERVSEANAETGQLFEELWNKGLGDGYKILSELDVLGENGLFTSDLLRNAYRKYRNLPIAYTPKRKSNESKRTKSVWLF
ncbi:hypothetical protein BC830DRAFT_1095350 [Chytriomyces sp. MP71]|nr:hypothetical protein BC830DRAFT_1095350 [Chytriomyces sp. MP71]